MFTSVQSHAPIQQENSSRIDGPELAWTAPGATGGHWGRLWFQTSGPTIRVFRRGRISQPLPGQRGPDQALRSRKDHKNTC